MFKNETILITGGTGSFGNAVLNRFLNTDIDEIRVFSRDEKKQDNMRIKYKNSKIKFIIGDVRNYKSISRAMFGVDYVFHAAALKQVPSCEFFPTEAVKTNILGSENVLESAVNNKVKKIVVLSTDKAVYPINAMGMTKALMEKVMISYARSGFSNGTVMCGTRYGNVMASRGSVIPLFISQIKNNKPITITDFQMTRFMMTLEDSIDLVLYAFKNGNSGDIFIQKAPATTVETLAQALKELYKSNVSVSIIGTRHGEKLYETLVNKEEMVRAENHENYYRIPADNRDLNYEPYFSEGDEHLSTVNEYNSHNTKRLSVEETKSLLLKIDLIRKDIINE
jgi:UDP-N-acetylglucosamine 4,6-dehydratase/5-epimerase